jgi:hypothetical protein
LNPWLAPRACSFCKQVAEHLFGEQYPKTDNAGAIIDGVWICDATLPDLALQAGVSRERSGCGRHGVGGRPDELEDLIGVGDHGHMVGRDLHGGGPHARGEQPLGSGRDHLVTIGDQNHQGSPRQAGTPITSPRALACNGCWTANRTRAVGRVDIGREVVDKVVLGQPGKALGVDLQMGQGRTHRARSSRAPIDSPASSPNPAT